MYKFRSKFYGTHVFRKVFIVAQQLNCVNCVVLLQADRACQTPHAQTTHTLTHSR